MGTSNLGLVCVTVAALLFGAVAALVKFIEIPPLVLLQFRSLVNWGLSLAVIAMYKGKSSWRKEKPRTRPS